MTMHRVAMAALLLAALSAGDARAAVDDAKPADLSAHEAAFQKMLTNAALVGFFTFNDKEKEGKLHKERYVISKVEKYNESYWTFHARITYGKKDVTVPLLLQVKWAGETAVLTGDDFKVPGMGTFSFRVLFHDNQYIGVWKHGEVGGQMFGTIERADEGDKAKPGESDKQ